MNKNLYVGNLTANVTAEDLRHNWSEIGTVVSAVIIMDKFTNTSKGFGFVEMETEEGARAAIQHFNGGSIDGSTITVNEAKPKNDDGHPRRDGVRTGGFRDNRSRGNGRY
ncbi:MAG: RNA-binding protein [Syntrophales bacterium]|nr:RNA-binding protein [Syntrophales bacterium]